MALTAQQEAFVVALFNKRDALIAIRDRFEPRYLFGLWRDQVLAKKAQLAAGSITQADYNAWLAANPQPGQGD